MSVIISKDEHRTIIASIDKKYIINQSPKGIELLLEPIKSERLSNDIMARLLIPIIHNIEIQKESIEKLPEMAIWPIPLKVLEDLQERTNGEIKIEDLSEYDKDLESGKEFFIRIGNILITTM